MPLRTRAQRTGDAAEGFVRALIDEHPSWLARSQDRDFGVDLEAELADPVDQDQRLAGKLVKIQVKGSEAWEVRDGRIAVPLRRTYLDYVQEFRLPVILVAANVTTREAWFVWLQDWLLQNEARLSQGEATETITVHIPDDQRLVDGLDWRLQSIARGEETTAMVLALRELALAATSAREKVIFDAVFDLLEKIDTPPHTWMVQKTVDTLIGLGPNVGFWRTSSLVPQIVESVERFGDSMTQEQIVRLVARGDTYSRTGLHGLSRLYDRWPDRAQALSLPAAFRAIDLEPVAWYCDLRERYAGLSSIDLWGALGARKLSDTRFGPLVLPDDEHVAYYLLSKWPNRGDSVFLDCLVLSESS